MCAVGQVESRSGGPAGATQRILLKNGRTTGSNRAVPPPLPGAVAQGKHRAAGTRQAPRAQHAVAPTISVPQPLILRQGRELGKITRPQVPALDALLDYRVSSGRQCVRRRNRSTNSAGRLSLPVASTSLVCRRQCPRLLSRDVRMSVRRGCNRSRAKVREGSAGSNPRTRGRTRCAALLL